MKLINLKSADSTMEQAFLDLDIIKLLRLAVPTLTEKEALSFALEAYESDPAELSARYAVLKHIADGRGGRNESPVPCR